MRIDSGLDVAGAVRLDGIPVRPARDFVYAETLWDGMSCPNNDWGIASWNPAQMYGRTDWFSPASPTDLTVPRGLYRFTAWWRSAYVPGNDHHLYLVLHPVRSLIRKLGVSGNETCASMILPLSGSTALQLRAYQSCGSTQNATARLLIERMDDV